MLRFIFICSLLCIFGCSSKIYEKEPVFVASGEQCLDSEISRIAATNILIRLRIEKYIKEGKEEEALNLLNTVIVSDLLYIRDFDAKLEHDENYLKVKNKSILKLKTYWLENPPESIPKVGRDLLQDLCQTVPDCPEGDIE